jgi:hypothetical protein
MYMTCVCALKSQVVSILQLRQELAGVINLAEHLGLVLGHWAQLILRVLYAVLSHCVLC